MDKKELNIILKEGEGYKIEFKESLSGLEKEFATFANSSGGRILLGVTDEGKIRFDELVEPKFNYPKDFDRNRYQRFLQLAGIYKIDDTEKLLTNLGVAEK